jgi:SAM-dependent methyltransferase
MASTAKITETLRMHYERSFRAHGATAKGVDWGECTADLVCRYDKMAAVMPAGAAGPVSLLDVGCGFGGFYEHLLARGIAVEYTGIDVVAQMIESARARHPGVRFILGDILESSEVVQYDYVVCNGILTQKLDVPAAEMDGFAARLIRRMFSLCRTGIGFNVMTTKVNYFANNLYYRNPAEMFAWCLTEFTRHIRIDHAYPLYEYTMYLYRTPTDQT